MAYNISPADDYLHQAYANAGIAPPAQFRLPRQRRQKQQDPPALTPEEEKSIWKELGSSMLSGVGNAATVLGTPGSVITGTIASIFGDHSMKQTFEGILDPSKRIYGREMLHKAFGMKPNNPNEWEWQDIAGFGADVITDPLTWGTMGLSATTKIGRAAKASGLMNKARLSQIASKKAGKWVGPRQASKTTTVQNLLDDLPLHEQIGKAKEFMDSAKVLGLKGKDILNRPVGASFGITNAPIFGKNLATFNLGKLGDVTSGGLDYIGRAMAGVKPGGALGIPARLGARLADAKVGGATGQAGQEFQRSLFASITEAEASGKGASIDLLNKFEKAAASTGKKLSPDRQDWLDIIRFRQHGEKIKGATTTAELQKVFDGMSDDLSNWQQRLNKNLGIPIKELDDLHAQYLTRRLTLGIKHADGGARVTATSGKNALEANRYPWLRDIKGGTAVIIKAGKEVYKLRQTGDDSVKRIKEYLKGEGVDDIYTKFLETPEGVRDSFKKPGRIGEMAKWLHGLGDDTLESGIFGNHPIIDFQSYMVGVKIQEATAEHFYRALADVLPQKSSKWFGGLDAAPVLQSGLKEKASTSIGSLLAEAGYTKSVALKRIAEYTGKTVEELGELRIPKQFADDMLKARQGFKAPEVVGDLLQVFDSYTNLWKALQTGVRPAFHARNRLSGLVRAVFTHGWSAGSQADARKILKGGLVSSKKYPVLERSVKELHGGVFNDETVTKFLSDQIYAFKVADKYSGQAASLTAGAGKEELVSGTLNSMRKNIPGNEPMGMIGRGITFPTQPVKDLAGMGDSTWNPWKGQVRGFGDQGISGMGAPHEVSTLAPMVAADSTGHYVESMNRIGPLLKKLRDGKSFAQAAKEVGEEQVQYGGRYFTAIERSFMSRVFPFYKFLRSQSTFVPRHLAQQPGGRMAQTIRGMETARGKDQVLPEHLASTLAIPIPKGTPLIGPKPNATGPRYLAGAGLMFEDALKFYNDIPQEAKARANPVAKSLGEITEGRSWFQAGPKGGRELQDMDPVIGRTMKNFQHQYQRHVKGLSDEQILEGIGKRPTRLGWGLDVLASNFGGAPLGMVKTATHAKKGLFAKGLSLLSGFRLSDVPLSVQQAIIREAKEDKMRKMDAKEFPIVYFTEAQKAEMTPEELIKAEGYENLTRLQHQLKKAGRYRSFSDQTGSSYA